MNERALKLLAVGPTGEVNPDPLVEWHFRFSPRARRWTRVSYYSKGSFRRGLPRVVSRSTVARETGVPEEAIAAWQAALLSSESSQGKASPVSLLAVGANGTIHEHPLADWNFEFFPQSRVWRRTRAQRNEVSRRAVAKKIGVTEELVRKWEEAAIAQWESRQTPADTEDGK